LVGVDSGDQGQATTAIRHGFNQESFVATRTTTSGIEADWMYRTVTGSRSHNKNSAAAARKMHDIFFFPAPGPASTFSPAAAAVLNH
jgi:hypothetical protein